MNLSTTKRFSYKANGYTSFYNETGEPRENIEGVVQIANSDCEPLDSFGGGGGAGGGSIVYTNAAGDFVATITNGTKNITITGLPFTLEAINVIGGSIKVIHVTTNEVEDIVMTSKTVSVSGGVITLAEADDFVTGDVVLVTLIGPDKAYDVALDQQLVAVQNPQYAHTTSVETLVDQDNLGTRNQHDTGANSATFVKAAGAYSNANIAVGYKIYNSTDGSNGTVTTVATTTITGPLGGGAENDWDVNDYGNLPGVARFEINMDTYNFLSIHYKITAAANNVAYMKIYGTLNSAATVDDDTNWVDLSADYLGAAAGVSTTGATIEDIVMISSPVTMLKYMVKIVSENSADAAFSNAFDIYVKKSS